MQQKGSDEDGRITGYVYEDEYWEFAGSFDFSAFTKREMAVMPMPKRCFSILFAPKSAPTFSAFMMLSLGQPVQGRWERVKVTLLRDVKRPSHPSPDPGNPGAM